MTRAGLVGLLLIGFGGAVQAEPRAWLAGDHHVHSQRSGEFLTFADGTTRYSPGIDGVYPIARNAERARAHGLAWMAAIDHGGLGLSAVRAQTVHAELLQSRQRVPEVIQFYGMEFDTPGADHSSLIMPIRPDEADQLRDLEAAYETHEVLGANAQRDKPALMLEALRAMAAQPSPPIVIANHPSRGARAPGDHQTDALARFRAWNDLAPDVAIGMEGAPGHQAAHSAWGRLPSDRRARGLYRGAPTLGGFDEMTARLGGVWDDLLSEGRHWWITANSDSHRNFRDGGEDFWPGEYAKTYVLARRDGDDILDGLRKGRVFATTGDLIASLDVVASAGKARASLGQTLPIKPGSAVTLDIRLRDPAAPNAAGRRPELRRIDVILGDVGASGPRARVVRRLSPSDWTRDGETISASVVLPALDHAAYVRLRGTAGEELEPASDAADEDPWADLWFYANPIFITPRAAPAVRSKTP
ncbi:phosphoesterase [Caulobacter sp.]|uniref:phosphoesterase n=1 Tax=Caulobacter sp. TaxID=78 RepID=UPI002B4A376C|nr:phosphoesterase [Caulobacter sp.]HJV43519.1 phosphoesterase [Caulobacter sp.]